LRETKLNSVFEILYFIGIILETFIRYPYRLRTRGNRITDDRLSRQEKFLLGLLWIGMFVLPLIYVLTPWLDFANYSLPDWAGWLGAALMAAAVFVFWRSQVDLGSNWSPTLRVREGHELVTKGLYRSVRHPMYLSQWLWSLAQILLLPNWIAGFASLVAFLPLYFLRVPKEEQMMLDNFGQEYRDYMQRTGRVLPRL
jgi:protein-S-isoprenylcysteine O-methyltransferase Ste14